jgi:hypothetical protein
MFTKTRRSLRVWVRSQSKGAGNLSEGGELEDASASSDTGITGRGRKEGHREWGVTLHLRFALFPYHRTMRLTCTCDHYHDSKYASHRPISPCEQGTRGRMQPWPIWYASWGICIKGWGCTGSSKYIRYLRGPQ